MDEEIKQAVRVAADPASIHWLTYLWVCVVSAWGGMVRFLNSMRDKRESFVDAMWHLTAGLVSSTFVGLLTFFACEAGGLDKMTTAVCVAITGHMGAQGIAALEKLVMARLKRVFSALFGE